MYEMKKVGRYGSGFIDPNTINEHTWKLEWYKQDVENKMLEFLKRLNTNEDRLLPYNYGESHCLILQILFLLTSQLDVNN